MSEKVRLPSLMDEFPLLVYPSLAIAMGINKAVVFQQLHFLLNAQKTSKNDYVFLEDRWWVYNTYAEWKETYFSWLSTVQLQRIFSDLQKEGLILTKQSVKNKSDRRKWYTIDYEVWDVVKKTLPSYQNDTINHHIKKTRSNISKVSDGYSETTTETTTEKITSPNGKAPKSELDTQYDIIAEMWGTKANGTIVSMRGMIFGSTKTRGQWKLCQFEPPATVEELKGFAPYMETRMKDKNLKDKPTTPVVIQRWFYDFREATAKNNAKKNAAPSEVIDIHTHPELFEDETTKRMRANLAVIEAEQKALVSA